MQNKIEKIQRCQRNWDYQKNIPLEVKEYLYNCAITTPTKQNIYSFNVHLFSNQQEIYKIAQCAEGKKLHANNKFHNPQVNAPLLFMWSYRISAIDEKEEISGVRPSKEGFIRETSIEVGISAGAVALASINFGLRTGFCRCYNQDQFPQHLAKKYNIDKTAFVLFLGVGYPILDVPHNICNQGEVRSTRNKPFIPKYIF